MMNIIFQFEQLKLKKKHLKFKNNTYSKPSMQQYLLRSDLTKENKQTLFCWKTRMARFGDNYRSGRGFVICPICQSHNDNQENSFHCKYILKAINIKGKYENIFNPVGQDLPILVETLSKIEQLRKDFLE